MVHVPINVSSCTKLILYLTATYPSTATFLNILETVSSIVDLFEIGVPTNNPKYDGPTVRMTHRAAELKGMEALDVLKGNVPRDFVIMAYMEDHVDKLELFLKKCAEVGARGVLMPDLLFDYYEMVEKFVNECRKFGLEPCFFISSKFPYREVERLVELRPLFIYLGLQACSGVRLPIFIERNVKIYRNIIGDRCPLIVGFAIKSPDDVKLLKRLRVDGIVIGSAFIKELSRCGIECGLKLLESLKRALVE
ncbi:MAG: tryptophan synthase subunit alpha [Crenarchaeota archaeon]|nr:tryptophan synthase subunit alpha [Thermoproteota archaeon]